MKSFLTFLFLMHFNSPWIYSDIISRVQLLFKLFFFCLINLLMISLLLLLPLSDYLQYSSLARISLLKLMSDLTFKDLPSHLKTHLCNDIKNPPCSHFLCFSLLLCLPANHIGTPFPHYLFPTPFPPTLLFLHSCSPSMPQCYLYPLLPVCSHWNANLAGHRFL